LVTYTFTVYSISALTLFLYVLLAGEPLGPYPASDWVYFILLALLPTLLGHTLFNWSLKWLSTSTISMAILFEPVGAAVLAYFLLEEYVSLYQAAGGLIVISGIMLFLADGRLIRKKTKRKDVGGYPQSPQQGN
jgi:drug/metabolite transporter (DMT)-like permease